ncbi:MAG: DUF4911 domain-containing protein [Desulfococcaceae bacterium]
MKTVKQYYRVDRRKIHFLKFILEGYDGVALLSTIDSRLGIVRVCIPPGCEEEVKEILRDVAETVRIEPVEYSLEPVESS